MAQRRVIILSSGGIDSTACIRFFQKMEFEVEALFFDYGQISKENELAALTSIAKFYGISFRNIVIRMEGQLKDGLIPGRNAVFYLTALMHLQKDCGIIASGIHTGTPYYDCSPSFLELIQGLFNGYSNGTVKASAPFLNFSKKEIWDYCQSEEVPVELTYSCELGKKQPCGLCDTCKDLEKLYAGSYKSN